MRKLKKSFTLGYEYAELIHSRKSNTSTKPHARLMHSLSVISFGENPHTSSTFGPIPMPTRAQRRLTLQPVPFPTCAFRRALTRAAKFGKPVPVYQPVPKVSPPERKLVGSVRRGLERGRVA